MNWTTDYFARKGIEHPRLETEWLLSHLLGCNRLEVYLNFERPLGREELRELREAIHERVSGKPLQLITGEVQFMGLALRVKEGVLIPRPETEILVERALELLSGMDHPSILDVGCGSGNISVSLAHYLPGAQVLALDKSARAIELTGENLARYGLEGRVTPILRDWLRFKTERRFDLVISNPPYVRDREYENLPVEVRGFEPAEALKGGVDGLKFIRSLIVKAPDFLKPGGWLLFEIGIAMANPCRELLQQANYRDVQVIPDLNKIPRVIVCRP